MRGASPLCLSNLTFTIQDGVFINSVNLESNKFTDVSSVIIDEYFNIVSIKENKKRNLDVLVQTDHNASYNSTGTVSSGKQFFYFNKDARQNGACLYILKKFKDYSYFNIIQKKLNLNKALYGLIH